MTEKSIFSEEIKLVEIEKVDPNPLNPRGVLDEAADDKLLESIAQKGILNPLIVYKTGERYTLLDGERRLNAARRLNFPTIPVHIVEHKVSSLENISMMFHIHNARQDWDDVATALALNTLINTIGTDDTKRLVEYTALPEYKIRKYKKILAYPKEVVDKFLEKSKKGEDERLDPDILIELERPIRYLKKEFPEVMKQYPKERIVDLVVEKKSNDKITKNPELRLLTKVIRSEKAKTDKDYVKDKIVEFFEKPEISIEELYEKTAKPEYLSDKIQLECTKLESQVVELNINEIKGDERKELKKSILSLKSTLSKLEKDLS